METTKIDGYQWVCPHCGKRIISVSKPQQSFNIGVHKQICSKSAEALVKVSPIGNLERKNG